MGKASDNPFPSVLLVTQGSTPSSPAAGRQRVFIDSADGHLKRVNSSGTVTDIEDAGGGGGGGPVPVGVVNGRLTTESGVPVSTSDRTAQSTIYFTPYNGNQIALYDGSDWQLETFSELSLALSGLTSGKNYDVFVDYNGGTPQLVLSAAWTNDTTRADALTLQDGVFVKDGATDHRYVGTIRTTGTTTTEDSGGIAGTTNVGGKRFVWNLYNQVLRNMRVIDTTDNWVYTTDTWRQARATAGNQVEYVVGLAGGHVIQARIHAAWFGGGNASKAAKVGIGLDSTSSPSGLRNLGYFSDTGVKYCPLTAEHVFHPTPGYHYIAWLEKGADVACSFVGDEADSLNGLTVTLWN